MSAYCYIIFSEQLDQYYVGATKNEVEHRLAQHNTRFFKGSFTSKAEDWTVFHLIRCQDFDQALRIEKHIKRMKSRAYIENLKKYPDMTIRLIKKFSSLE